MEILEFDEFNVCASSSLCFELNSHGRGEQPSWWERSIFLWWNQREGSEGEVLKLGCTLWQQL